MPLSRGVALPVALIGLLALVAVGCGDAEPTIEGGLEGVLGGDGLADVRDRPDGTNPSRPAATGRVAAAPFYEAPEPEDLLADLAFAVETNNLILEPSFSSEVLAYTLAVPSGATEVFVQLAPEDASVEVTASWHGETVFLDAGTTWQDVAIGVSTLSVEVQGSGAAVTRYEIALRRPPTVTRPTLVDHDYRDANDDFGYAVAISGDTVVVGVPGDDSHADGMDRDHGIQGDPSDNLIPGWDAGAIFVYDLDGNVTDYLTPLDTAPQDPTTKSLGWDDRVGTSVAIDGDTIVAGAPGWKDGAGKAYVFTRSPSSGAWRQAAELVPAVSTAGSAFGTSVAISGDTIVVGAPYEDSGAFITNGDPNRTDKPDAGAAYVFEKMEGRWRQVEYLKGWDPDSDDRFGSSVAVLDTVVVVGAPGQDSYWDLRDVGFVYLFENASGTWRYADRFSLEVQHAAHGTSVSIAPGPSEERFTIAAGAPCPSPCVYAGYVTVDEFSGRERLTGSVLRAYHGLGPSADEFGHAVALSGDFLVVGAPAEDSWAPEDVFQRNPPGDAGTAEDSGAVYIFRRGDDWNAHGFLKVGTTVGGLAGWSVAADADTQALVSGQRRPAELNVVPRDGDVVIAPLSPPKFNGHLSLPETPDVGGAIRF
ncbi:MAG: hypothetical protein WBG86_08155 [Polyangiales bacterium]